jgi:hypothetical protein
MAFGLAAGTVRSMVGFAMSVAQTPRKTRFRLLVRLCRVRLAHWVPTKGFRSSRHENPPFPNFPGATFFKMSRSRCTR